MDMSKNLARQKTSPKYNGQAPELRRALAYVGLFTRVAERESLSVGHVVQVAKGRRTSKRVINAIVREVHRIEQRSEIAA
jgi:hypothetical protein